MAYFTRLLLLLVVTLGLPDRLVAQSNDLRELFGKAYQLYQSGNPAQAKELFQQTVEATHRLADYSLYYLASIAFAVYLASSEDLIDTTIALSLERMKAE